MSKVFGPFQNNLDKSTKVLDLLKDKSLVFVKSKLTFKKWTYDKSTFPGLYGLAQEIHEALM